nr:MAG TPA: hypothetical protein [Caudoviricetes sp.]
MILILCINYSPAYHHHLSLLYFIFKGLFLNLIYLL